MAKAPSTKPRRSRKPALPRVPLPRQIGGRHEDKSKRPIRKRKYRTPPAEDE